MARQQLWIINSTLLVLMLLSTFAAYLIKKDLPRSQQKRRTVIVNETKSPRLIVTPEKIYQNDLFDTFTPPNEPLPTAKNLVTPIPQLNIKSAPTPPKAARVEFIPPLDITIRGIVMSPTPKNSIAMIADQIGKEQIYHIGDKINDGQVIKITKNQVIIIRGNGQQETFYLRKPEKLSPGLSSWDLAVRKIDNLLYHIDPIELTKELTSLGEVIEALDLCAAYKDGASIGVRVGSTKHHPLAATIGLTSGDVITKINDLPATTSKERIAIYDAVAALPMGGHIHVTLLRDGKEVALSYLLKRLERPSAFGSSPEAKSNKAQGVPDDLFKLSKDAERQQSRRRFEHLHRTQDQHNVAVADMRKKMLDDMKNRAPNRRVQ